MCVRIDDVSRTESLKYGLKKKIPPRPQPIIHEYCFAFGVLVSPRI